MRMTKAALEQELVDLQKKYEMAQHQSIENNTLLVAERARTVELTRVVNTLRVQMGKKDDQIRDKQAQIHDAAVDLAAELRTLKEKICLLGG